MKNIVTGTLLLMLFSGMAFAEGQVDERYYTDANSQIETFSGVLKLDNRYPVLSSSDGKIYYLQLFAPIHEQDLPKVGDKLEVQAFRDYGNPNVLFVQTAKVNGKEVRFSSMHWNYMSGPGGWRHMGPYWRR